MADTVVKQVRVEVDDKGSLKRTSRAAAQADRNIKGVANASSGASKNFSKMSQGLRGVLVPAYATLAANIFALTAAFGALSRAADIENMRKGLEIMTIQTGANLQGMVISLQEATNGMLSFAEASRASAIWAQAGFNAPQLERLGKVAKAASVALGRNMTDSMDRLIRGVVKAEPELLDELGIILRLKPASDKYARSLNKTAEELSTFEKQQAILNEVLTQGERKFKTLLEEQTINDFTRLHAVWSTLIQDALALLNNVLKPIASFFSRNNEALVGIFAYMAITITRQAAPALDAIGLRFASLGTGAHNLAVGMGSLANKGFSVATRQANKAAEAMDSHAVALKRNIDISKLGKKSPFRMAIEAGKGGEELARAAQKTLRGMRPEFDKFGKATKGAFKGTRDEFIALKKVNDKVAKGVVVTSKNMWNRISLVTARGAAAVSGSIARTTGAFMMMAQTSSQVGNLIERKGFVRSLQVSIRYIKMTAASNGILAASFRAVGVATAFASKAIGGLMRLLGPIILLTTAISYIRDTMKTPQLKALEQAQEDYNNSVKESVKVLTRLGKTFKILNNVQEENISGMINTADYYQTIINVSNTIIGQYDTEIEKLQELKEARKAAYTDIDPFAEEIADAANDVAENTALLMQAEKKKGVPGDSWWKRLKNSFHWSREKAEAGIDSPVMKGDDWVTLFKYRLEKSLNDLDRFTQMNEVAKAKMTEIIEETFSSEKGDIAPEALISTGSLRNTFNLLKRHFKEFGASPVFSGIKTRIAENMGEPLENLANALNTDNFEWFQEVMEKIGEGKAITAVTELQKIMKTSVKPLLEVGAAYIAYKNSVEALSKKHSEYWKETKTSAQKVQDEFHNIIRLSNEYVDKVTKLGNEDKDAGFKAHAKNLEEFAKSYGINTEEILEGTDSAEDRINKLSAAIENLASAYDDLVKAQKEVALDRIGAVIGAAGLKGATNYSAELNALRAEQALMLIEGKKGSPRFDELGAKIGKIEDIQKTKQLKLENEHILKVKQLQQELDKEYITNIDLVNQKYISQQTLVASLLKDELISAELARELTAELEKQRKKEEEIARIKYKIAEQAQFEKTMTSIAGKTDGMGEFLTMFDNLKSLNDVLNDSEASWKGWASAAANAAQGVLGALNSVMQANHMMYNAEIELEQKRDGKSEESLGKIKALKIKMLKEQQSMAMAQIAISTASAAMKAYSTFAAFPPAAALAAGIVIAFGAKQMAAVKKATSAKIAALDTTAAPATAITLGKRDTGVDVSGGATAAELDSIRGRAYGGDAQEGAGYLVGEHGPELFVPDTSGNIKSNQNISNGQPVNVNFSISTVDASGVEDLLTNQRGHIVGLIREAAWSQGQRFLED